MTLHTFIGGEDGEWTVTSMTTVLGEEMAAVAAVRAVDGGASPVPCGWSLAGVTSNARYLTAEEAVELRAVEAGLGRGSSTLAALIPIRKSPAWWAMAQDERRAIIERSHHVPLGLGHLPAVARRLHHCRDLGSTQPFDFLTWFEFAPEDAPGFDTLVADLRATEEWGYVEREVDIRLARRD